MSEQSKILAEMQQLVMNILKNGSASVAEGDRLDELEELMLNQKCYKKIEHEEHSYLGEEIGGLFFDDLYMEAIDKMFEYEIVPEEFFEFAEYHYEDEDLIEMFTNSFIADVNKVYQSKQETSQ